LLETYLRDNVNTKVLRSDGTYRRVALGNAKPVDSQLMFVGDDIGY